VDRRDCLRYTGCRLTDRAVGYDLVVHPGAPHASSALDTFLTGRWSAYVVYGAIAVRYDVEHEPWPLHHARIVRCQETMLRAIGLEVGDVFAAHYAPAVSARLAPRNAFRIMTARVSVGAPGAET
jgi:uncharacterized protein YqjF (DUF2071 family)